MNPRFYALAFFAAAASGCATVPAEPPETPAEAQTRCKATATVTAVGQQAKNAGMSQAEFDQRLNSILQDEELNAKEKAIVKKGLTAGYAGVKGAHPGIIAQKAFDDCMAGK